jgi:hypothetical protein
MHKTKKVLITLVIGLKYVLFIKLSLKYSH